MVRRIFPLVTVHDAEAMPDDGNRYEIIDGEMFMSRAPSLDHQFIVGRLIILFDRTLSVHPVGRTFPGAGIVFDKFNGVIPDFIYVSHDRFPEVTDGVRFTAAPELVVEILSPGRENEERDRLDKRYLYSRFEAQEYWIIDPERRQLEIYRLTGSTLELAATHAGGSEVTSSVLPGLRFAAEEIFAS